MRNIGSIFVLLGRRYHRFGLQISKIGRIEHDGGKAIIGNMLDELSDLFWPIVNQENIWSKRTVHETVMWDSFGH